MAKSSRITLCSFCGKSQAEVRKIIADATEEVRAILLARRTALEAVAQRLIDREVISGAELKTIIDAHDPALRLVPGSVAVASGNREQRTEDRGQNSAAGK